jgi:hypothetical protein
MTGQILGACNCDWGCPCNFDAPPTYGHCDGVYTLVIEQGRYGETDLGGVTFLFGGHSPQAIHLGGGEDWVIVDERATEAQRTAIVTLWRGDGTGSPFEEFASVMDVRGEPMVGRIEVQLDGIRSTVQVRGGADVDLALERIRNPVTGEEEELYLDKPSGFTSLRSELGNVATGDVRAGGMTWDLAGRYAEHAEFSYAGP